MAVNNSLAKQQETFGQYISKAIVKQSITNAFGNERGQRFMSAVLSAVTVNPLLQECEFSTIISAAMLGESLNLTPSPQLGQYYLVPFNDRRNNRKVATFILGWKGYVQLAIRSGQYKKLNVLALKEGELKKWNPMTEEIEVSLIEDSEARNKANTIGYYAMYEYLNGFQKILYWKKSEMEIHADRYSKAYGADKQYKTSKSFWTTDFDSQALKTMIRQLISKWGIMSVEMQQAFEAEKFENENEIDIPTTIPHPKDDPIINAEVVESKPIDMKNLQENENGELFDMTTGKKI